MQPAERCVLQSEVVDDAEWMRSRLSLLKLSTDIADSKDTMLVHEPVESQLERRARLHDGAPCRAALIMLEMDFMLSLGYRAFTIGDQLNLCVLSSGEKL